MTTVGSLSLSERLKLNKLYRSGPAAFGSLNNLIKLSGLPRVEVSQFLVSKPSYTKFKNRRRKFPRLQVKARLINDIWCMDLAEVDKLSWNSNTKSLIVSVDVFSRFVRGQPMRNKNAETTRAAFIRMCSDQGNNLIFPKKLWVNRGKEFFGDFRDFCQDVGIHIYHTCSETKACFAERAIRSLKSLIYKYLEERRTDCYLPKLQDFTRTLNTRVNRSTGLPPEKVQNGDFMTILYKESMKTNRLPSLKIEFVRIAKVSTSFAKGYKPQFTHEIFKVIDIKTTTPRVSYELEDLNGEKIFGKFYPEELSKQKPQCLTQSFSDGNL